jgi:hypothetical protein
MTAIMVLALAQRARDRESRQNHTAYTQRLTQETSPPLHLALALSETWPVHDKT